MFVEQKKSHDPNVRTFAPRMDLLSRISRRVRRERIRRDFARYRGSRPAGYETFSDDRGREGRTLVRQLPPCDVIHLRWIAKFVDYRGFFDHVPADIPIVWTLDDMNAFTGGCHFDDGCGKFLAGCQACPQLGSTDQHDLAYRIWARKQDLFDRLESGRLSFVTPSQWLATLVKASPLLRKFPVTVIPYGLDTDTFCPQPQDKARAQLGIPGDVGVILFVSHGVNLRRKGLAFLRDALKRGAGDTWLLSIGQGKPELDSDIPGRHLGTITDDAVLASVYNAADIFVCPSLQDNLPNTVLEALACGTPVVAFDAGGIPDMVRPEATGLVVPTGDAKALHDALMRLLGDRCLRDKMADNCRRIALSEYSLEVQAQRYLQLYENLAVAHPFAQQAREFATLL